LLSQLAMKRKYFPIIYQIN